MDGYEQRLVWQTAQHPGRCSCRLRKGLSAARARRPGARRACSTLASSGTPPRTRWCTLGCRARTGPSRRRWCAPSGTQLLPLCMLTRLCPAKCSSSAPAGGAAACQELTWDCCLGCRRVRAPRAPGGTTPPPALSWRRAPASWGATPSRPRMTMWSPHHGAQAPPLPGHLAQRREHFVCESIACIPSTRTRRATRRTQTHRWPHPSAAHVCPGAAGRPCRASSCRSISARWRLRLPVSTRTACR